MTRATIRAHVVDRLRGRRRIVRVEVRVGAQSCRVQRQ